MGYVLLRFRVLTTIAKLSAAKPIVATRPLPTGGNRTGAIVTAAGRGFRSGPETARLNPAGAGCGIKNVVTIRATSVIIQLCRIDPNGRVHDNCC
jgi:hypothetical protein